MLYQIALTSVPQVGTVQARLLVEKIGSAQAIFKTPPRQLEKIEGIGSVRAKNIHSFKNFAEAEREIRFLEKYKIKPLFLTSEEYPRRLLHCYDPPTLLYYRGEADLNASRVVSVIGTRSNTDYGKQLVENLLKELSSQQVVIISGLAFGVDALAHRAALKQHLPTVAVLAHGLDTIYPDQHYPLAREIVKQRGGLLTEFRSNIKPDKHHFPTRNRIVAGICDALVVIESGTRGGSMVTAELANGYNKDIFAFPGKISDVKSSGCNHLIKTNKAVLLSSTDELLQAMGWLNSKKNHIKKQKELFIQLSDHEKIIVDLLKQHGELSIDDLNFLAALSSSAVAAAILNLEFEGIIKSLPGKRYRLMD